MTFRSIYESAVRMICEDPADTSDYEERAGYLLAGFCTRALSTDRQYRLAHGLPPAGGIPTVCADLEQDFPLSDAFAPIAVFYLASLLVIDENEAMSDTLFSRYSDGMSEIIRDLPCRQEAISDCYGAI